MPDTDSNMTDYASMNQLLFEGKAPEVHRLTEEAIDNGRDVHEVLNDGLIAGMNVVGEDFKRNRVYLPEVVLAARAMKAGMTVLNPLLTAQQGEGERFLGFLGDDDGGRAVGLDPLLGGLLDDQDDRRLDGLQRGLDDELRSHQSRPRLRVGHREQGDAQPAHCARAQGLHERGPDGRGRELL